MLPLEAVSEAAWQGGKQSIKVISQTISEQAEFAARFAPEISEVER